MLRRKFPIPFVLALTLTASLVAQNRPALFADGQPNLRQRAFMLTK